MSFFFSFLSLMVVVLFVAIIGMGSCLSMGQWKELELQALIFRHLVEGATVPPQLLHHLVLSKSFLLSPSPSPSYYHPLQHFYSHYHHPSIMQSGYWGRGSMDPEPGRCRRTDGKKWRCSRDVVAGQKYCERHVHRGRNRSRKPVEIPTPSTTYSVGGGYGGVASDGSSATALKTTVPFASQVLASGVHFDRPGPSVDLHQLNHRSSESRSDNKALFETQNEVQKSGTGVLHPFFDDWPPRSLQEPGTALSISTPGINPPSDFSLKLSTGNGDGVGQRDGNNVDRDRLQLNWAGEWGTNLAAPMGGPLAEALRSSSTSNFSPTSVLHRLQRGSPSETSYIST
ncbi:hypothetical protein RHSIM_Rhsim04G0134400 [Rhododendron simsii]|uniref:Growth-regulating factor n=1 Tax=Rhododendron simsii TaxID=118357 RepID=A0A834H7Y9_RHOSS|nr:hypothetical protein RHSIM_Rhsim04G0134400 [Rhododendron simsii]